jgi:hypothetical protein
MVRKAAKKSRRKSKGDYLLSRLKVAFVQSKRPGRHIGMQAFGARLLQADEPPLVVADRSHEEIVAGTIFDPSDPRVRGLWAQWALQLNPDAPSDRAMLKAFEAAGLDHNDPFAWRQLLDLFSQAYFDAPGAGRKREWPASRYNELLSDFEHVQSQHPDLKKSEDVCRRLLNREPHKSKYKEYNSAEYLAGKVAEARDPEQNYFLKHPEMPTRYRPVREAAERLGYKWSGWERHFVKLFDVIISGSAKTFANDLIDKLIAEGPAAAQKNADEVDPRLNIIRQAYEDRAFSWSREAQSNALRILTVLDEGWSKVKKG